MGRTKQPGTETGAIKDKAFMGRNEHPTNSIQTGELKDKAFMGRAKPASTEAGTIKDNAFMGRDEPAKPGH